MARFYLFRINKHARIRDLIMWPIASRVLGSVYSDNVPLQSGFSMKIDMRDILGRLILFYAPNLEYFWEPQTLKLARLILERANGDVITAGAHIGYTALMLRTFLRGGRIFAFEPVSYLYAIAADNFSLNKNLGPIHCMRTALDDKNGTATVYIDTLRSTLLGAGAIKGTMSESEIVSTATIDSVVKQNNIRELSLVFLDIEGYEFER